ncbi:SIMPL domain-containing protein [Candidatus Odyssella thessalonicensis]|uniref:SIMPL domain-containing protein n=1 Tax=Candidatus Odyssella thessalonicensis TaxID=84647 RepID=UPI000225ABDB|nr:SIMPL domain-containing protein [Candidatus Odyssella thessalonicensis]
MSQPNKFSGVLSQLGFGLALGIATVICTTIIATTYVKVKESQRSIQVKGYAEQRIVSENGVWKGTVYAENVKATEAYRQLEHVKARALELLKKEGYEPQDIILKSVFRQEMHKKTADGHFETNEIELYKLSQDIEVFSNDVHKISDLPAKINALNLEGLNVSSGRLWFYYPSDKLDLLKVSLLSEASKRARERAEQFASSSGNQLGKLLNARQGVFQVTAPNSSDISDYGIYDTSSIDKVVKIVVTMTFGVD